MNREEKQLAKYIGQRLYTIRRSLGENQETFAARLHVSQSQLSKLENGERHLSATVVLELSRTLQIGVGTLFPPLKGDDVVDDEAELIEAWRAREYPRLLDLVARHMREDAGILRPGKRSGNAKSE